MMQARHLAGDEARHTRWNKITLFWLDSYSQQCYMFISFANQSFWGTSSRNIHRIVLGVRNKRRRETLPRTHQQSVHGRVEMDSHAVTTVL